MVNSAIAVSASSYAAGDDMSITVTLRDSQNNPVNDASAQSTSTTVTVANAAMKAGSSCTDNADGTYSATYTAQTAGTGLNAQVKLSTWATGAQSAAYAITASAPVAVKSTIHTDATTYVAGDDMHITVTLNDGQNNPVSGAASQLTATTVMVANAELKAGSSWADNADGTYTATYTAQTTGTGLNAQVKLSTWATGAQSAAYAITTSAPAGDPLRDRHRCHHLCGR